jgi:hypothetical protein
MIAGYVIIGGGSTGVRLSKTPAARVVVIESRGPKRRPCHASQSRFSRDAMPHDRP